MGEVLVKDVMVEDEKDSLFPSRLWVITYDLRGVGKGIAMVKASNANDAAQILKTNGMYNGTQSEYLVTKIEEIITPPCCGLMAEQNVEFFSSVYDG